MQLTLLTHLETVRVMCCIGIAFIAVPIAFYVIRAIKKFKSPALVSRIFGIVLAAGICCELPSVYYAYLNGQYHISKYSKSDILYIAAENKSFKHIRIMLKKGADPSAVTRFGQTSVYNSADKGDVDSVRLMAEYGCDLNSSGGMYTPLCAACKNGDIEMAEVLLALGASPDYDPERYPSALNCAAAFDEGYNYELIKLLCDFGADRSAVVRDSNGRRWLPFKYYFHKEWQSVLTPEERENYNKIAGLLEQPYKDWVMEHAPTNYEDT